MKILVLIWVVLLLFSFTTSNMNTTRETYTLTNATNLAKPGCESRCGNLIVPYPFGIGINSNCSMGRMFDLHCNTSSNPPKAVFSKSSSTSVKLISDSTLRTSNRVAVRCYDSHGNVEQSLYVFANSTDSPYTYSEKNKFTLIGCNDYAWLTSETKSRNVSTGCIVFCPKQEDSPGGECSGNGCCQSSIPNDIRSLKTKIRALQKPDSKNDTRIVSRCTYAFIGEENVFKYNGAKDLNDESFVARTEASVPVVLEWAIGHMSCPEAEATPGFACQSNSRCINSTRESRGYRCICKEGYQGNSYLFPGCQDRCGVFDASGQTVLAMSTHLHHEEEGSIGSDEAKMGIAGPCDEYEIPHGCCWVLDLRPLCSSSQIHGNILFVYSSVFLGISKSANSSNENSHSSNTSVPFPGNPSVSSVDSQSDSNSTLIDETSSIEESEGFRGC